MTAGTMNEQRVSVHLGGPRAQGAPVLASMAAMMLAWLLHAGFPPHVSFFGWEAPLHTASM